VLDAIGVIFESKLQKVIATVSDLTTELKKAKDDTDTLKLANEQLMQDIREKDHKIQQNLTRIKQMDSYLRMDNLVIKGLLEAYATAVANNSNDSSTTPTTNPHQSRDTTLAAVINLCRNHLKVNVIANNI